MRRSERTKPSRPRPPYGTRGPSRASAEQGFTLLELMIVTVILGILAMVAANFVGEARQRAMVSATKANVRSAITAIEQFQVVTGRLPTQASDLAQVGFGLPADVQFCTFEAAGGGNEERHVHMRAIHRGSETLVATRYPLWNGELREEPARGNCRWTAGRGGGNQGGGNQGGGNQGGGNRGGGNQGGGDGQGRGGGQGGGRR